MTDDDSEYPKRTVRSIYSPSPYPPSSNYTSARHKYLDRDRPSRQPPRVLMIVMIPTSLTRVSDILRVDIYILDYVQNMQLGKVEAIP